MPTAQHSLAPRELEDITAASILHVGSYDLFMDTYTALARWIDANGLYHIFFAQNLGFSLTVLHDHLDAERLRAHLKREGYDVNWKDEQKSLSNRPERC